MIHRARIAAIVLVLACVAVVLAVILARPHSTTESPPAAMDVASKPVSVSLAQFAETPPAIDREPEESGVILGQVFDHLGNPAGGASIQIQHKGDIAYSADAIASSPITVEVGADGRFQFEEVPWGRYAILATRETYAARSGALLRPEAPVCQVDLVLRRVGVIRGVVVNPSREPVAGAQIATISHDGEERWGKIRTETGADGAFELAWMEPKTWTLLIEADGYAPLKTDPVFVDGDPSVFIVGLGGTLPIQIVDDATGRPLPDCTIGVADANAWQIRSEYTSGPDGKVMVDHLEVGTYAITGKDKVYVPAEGEVLAEVLPYGQATPQAVVRMIEGAVIRGRVHDSDSGEGIAGCRLMAQHDENGLYYEVITEVGTGAYEFSGVQPGSVRINLVDKPRGYEGTLLGRTNPTGIGAEIAQRSKEFRTVQVGPGEVLEGVDFPVFTGLSVSGVLIDSNGVPVAGIRVMASGSTGERGDGSHVGYTADVMTGAQGQFSFGQCLPGMGFTLRIMMEGRGEIREGPYRLSDKNLTGLEVVVDVAGALCIAGQTVDANGNPIRAAVRARPILDAQLSVRTNSDSDGNFLLRGLAAGEYAIQAMDYAIRKGQRGDYPIVDTVTLRPGQNLTGLRIVVDSLTASINGYVMDPAGKPMRGVTVTASPVEDDDSEYLRASQARTNRDGSFEIQGLSPGPHTVGAVAIDGTRARLRAVMAGSTDIVLTMGQMD